MFSPSLPLWPYHYYPIGGKNNLVFGFQFVVSTPANRDSDAESIAHPHHAAFAYYGHPLPLLPLDIEKNLDYILVKHKGWGL
jgi:hypothetical protein